MKDILEFTSIDMKEYECIATKTVPSSAMVFEGHFPGMSILPGVYHIGFAYEVSRELLLSLGYASVELIGILKFNFRKMILPDQIITIRTSLIKESNNKWELLCSNHVEGELVSSGVLMFQEQPHEKEVRHCITLHSSEMLKSGVDEVCAKIPNRFPILHVDGILSILPEKEIRTIKNISANDYVFWGQEPGSHFPEYMLLEVFAQSAGTLFMQDRDGLPLLGTIRGAIFANRTYPGEQLTINVTTSRVFSDKCIVSGTIETDNKRILELDSLIFALKAYE